ncbi:MAG: hypothetical protein WC787_04490 [Patescibacteria group bacterium]|jgi:hypothetical protein
MYRYAYLLIALFVLLVGCRDGVSQQEYVRIEEDVPHESESEPEESRSVRSDLMKASRMFGNEPDDSEDPYTTDVYLNANCELNPERMEIVTHQYFEALCSHIVATALVDDDGDFYEIGASFDWNIEDSSSMTLTCMNGPHDNHCYAIAERDLFDNGGEEPETVVMACVENDCDELQGCSDTVCRSVTVVNVAKMEGSWAFSWEDTLDATFFFMQDGRSFYDELENLNGTIQNDFVSFIWGDYLFEGTLGSDRITLTGTVTDRIVLSPAGTWSATYL